MRSTPQALLANIATTAVAGTVYLIEHGKANVLIRALLFCAAVFFTCALFIIWVFAVFRAWRNMGAKDNTVRTEEEKVRYFIVLVGCGAAAMVAMMFAVLYLP